jgi:hypothetical protein
MRYLQRQQPDRTTTTTVSQQLPELLGIPTTDCEVKGEGRYEQDILVLPDVVQAHDVRVVDELHDDDLALDARGVLVSFSVGLGDGHPGGHKGVFGEDLDGGVLARLGVFGDLDSA